MRRVLLGSISVAAAATVVIMIVASTGSSAAPALTRTPSVLASQLSHLLARMAAPRHAPLAASRHAPLAPRAVPHLQLPNDGMSCPAAAGSGSGRGAGGSCSEIPCVEFVGPQPVASAVPVEAVPLTGVVAVAVARPVPAPLQRQSVIPARSCKRQPPVTGRALPVTGRVNSASGN